MKSLDDIPYLSLLSDAFGFSMLRVLFRKTSKKYYEWVLEFMSFIV